VSEILEIRNATVKYGKSVAIEDLSLCVQEGRIVTLIGSNGAGKSTTLNAALGMVPLAAGRVVFRGSEVTGAGTSERVKGGMVLVPEGRHLFPYLSVYKNLLLGATQRTDKKAIMEDLRYVYELFPKLKSRAKQKAGTLSGGEQQMVAIARGMMANPKLLCLDEPSLGLAPVVIEDVARAIREINKDRGTSILLVEQNVHLAFGVADYCYTLQVGRCVACGCAEDMKQNDIVRKAYFCG
jgi:branched-chain amino acid transport system ATP-binding protein